MTRTENQRLAGKRAKLLGHAAEARFAGFFSDSLHETEFRAQADNTLNQETASLLASLGVSGRRVSTKSGSTFQIHLGNIPELSDKEYFHGSLERRVVKGKMSTCGKHSRSFHEQVSVLSSTEFWQSYLGKQSDFLCFEVPNETTFEFYSMAASIQFICDRFTWRLLETGRIKGDIRTLTGEERTGVITFEYRDNKRQFNLGCNGSSADGGNGRTFFKMLRSEVPCVSLSPRR
jgi:hypothetical protein